jgi:hypothetical protein
MATRKAKRVRPPVEDDVLATAHGLAIALHRVGAMDAVSMRDMDQLCLPPRPDYGRADARSQQAR